MFVLQIWNALYVIYLTFLYLTINCVDAAHAQQSQDLFSCCSETSGSCKIACEKMSLVEVAADSEGREGHLHGVKRFCSPELTSFWQCMNQTLQAHVNGWEISRLPDLRDRDAHQISGLNTAGSWKSINRTAIIRGSDWSGRPCCTLALAPRCQHACSTGGARRDLDIRCRQSDEQTLYTCVDRQERGDECCGHARTSDCHQACRTIYLSRLTPSREARAFVNEACSDHSPRVLQCVRNFTKLTPAVNLLKYMPCCDHSSVSDCRDACKKALRTSLSHQEMVDSLQEGGCGPPLPHDELWQCFLAGDREQVVKSPNELSRIDQMGMDSAKLHCCPLAKASQCRRLCFKTFTNDWANKWEDFDNECLSQLSEESLRHCIDEVEEPCELGCDGLSFCSNFNNRPTELFRSCTSQADMAAQYDVALWQQQGFLGLPGLQLPVLNISRCSPDTWRAVACTLQIKPCSRHSHVNQICRGDCHQVLSQCMDWGRMPPGYTASSLCAKLSPENQDTPCISLQPFLEPSDSPYSDPQHQVTSPCRGDPCNTTQVCSVTRCPGARCQPYSCDNGCALGEASQYLVPEGSYVRIPINSQQKGCLKICKCGAKGLIEQCQPLPCISYDSCMLASRKIEHGAWFYVECNVCSCFAGEIICSKKQCAIPGISGMPRNSRFTSLPCNCQPHYVPVCGKNGNTYPSLCLAKCSGLRDAEIEHGPCRTGDPCEGAPCGPHQSCVPQTKVCLSALHRPCEQYQCVNTTLPCHLHPPEPVCDNSGITHRSPCAMLLAGASMAYRGPCLTGCSNEQTTVCGANGNTYPSECSAWADFSTVDYPGSCLAVGLINDDPKEGQCGPQVHCAPLTRPNCLGYTPPGACCPVCGGAIRLLYSRKQIDRALYALRGHSMTSLTLNSILTSLQRQIQVAECQLTGYLSVELDLFILVVSTERHPSPLQLEACVRESEKLASLIRRQSPRVASELSLSALTAATAVHKAISGDVRWLINNWILVATLLNVLHAFAM